MFLITKDILLSGLWVNLHFQCTKRLKFPEPKAYLYVDKPANPTGPRA